MSAEPAGPSQFAFGDFVLDVDRAALLRRGAEIKLRPQAFDVLLYLVRHDGRLVSKQEFFEQVWRGVAVTDGALVQCIIDIRQALGDGASCIKTVPRRGYIFDGSRVASLGSGVQVEGRESNTGLESRVGGQEVALDSRPSTLTPDARLPPPDSPSSRAIVPAVIVGIVLVALVAALIARRSIPAWWSGAARGPVRAMAVLPLDNLSGDPAQEYVADGMTEALITSLAQQGGVRVISRTSVMRFKGAKTPLPDIARELNVDAVVEGSVTRSGTRVRVTAQLIDGRSDRHLWARSYERDLGDLLALQSELARAIAGEVQASLGPSDERRPARDARIAPEGEDAYLQGRYHLNKGTQEEIQKGIVFFRQAVAANPRDARGYAGLATAFLALSDFYRPPADMLPQAKDAALAALALDDSLAESHTALGAVRFLYDWDWAGADQELSRATALNPGSADAHIWYAVYLAQAGRIDAALAEVRVAQALDPLSSVVHVESGWVHYLARQPEQALADWRRVRDLEPQFAFSHTAIWAAYLPGFEAAPATRDGGRTREPDAMDLAAQIGACAVAGKRDDASRLIGRLQARSAHEYFCPYEMATAEAMLGRRDEAFTWLSRSVAERSGCVPSVKTDPRLDSLRADPRFAEVLRAANVPR